MIFTQADKESLKVHKVIRKNAKDENKVKAAKTVHGCQYCDFKSYHKTSVTRHETNQH